MRIADRIRLVPWLARTSSWPLPTTHELLRGWKDANELLASLDPHLAAAEGTEPRRRRTWLRCAPPPSPKKRR